MNSEVQEPIIYYKSIENDWRGTKNTFFRGLLPIRYSSKSVRQISPEAPGLDAMALLIDVVWRATSKLARYYWSFPSTDDYGFSPSIEKNERHINHYGWVGVLSLGPVLSDRKTKKLKLI